MAKKTKSPIAIWIEYIPFWMLYQVMRMIPLKTAYAVSGFLVSIAYYFDAKHRNRTINHLLHAGVAENRRDAVKLAKKCFRQLSMLLVEIFKMDQCYSKEKITVSGPPESVREFYKHSALRKNFILLSAHYGNWEIAGHATSEQCGRKLSSMMRAFDNPKIGDLIIAHRGSELHTLIPRNLGLRQGLKTLNEGNIFALLIDQHASRTEGVENVFFGHPCRTHKTPALVHLKTGIPLIPEVTKRLPGKDFRFEIKLGNMIMYTPTENKERDIQTVAQMCTTELEKLIREEPEQWLWAARRWLDADGRSR
jgi:KDO2-lipid IV(A) lauroyltransferase